MSIWTQKSALIQLRTSLLKFDDLAEHFERSSVSNLSTKVQTPDDMRCGVAGAPSIKTEIKLVKVKDVMDRNGNEYSPFDTVHADGSACFEWSPPMIKTISSIQQRNVSAITAITTTTHMEKECASHLLLSWCSEHSIRHVAMLAAWKRLLCA